MNYLDQVDVTGFWGERRLTFNFHRDVNFIIGVNGSGKTTAVNLIVAALTADFRVLDQQEFQQITIKLKSTEHRKKSTIAIFKKQKDGTPFSSIQYEIKKSSTDPAIKFSLDDFEEQLYLRGMPRHLIDREMYRRHGASIVNELKQLVNVSWLSVHRSSKSIDNHAEDSRKYESSVDLKLKELSNRLVRYFSSLGKKDSVHLEQFQKSVFLSLLLGKGDKAIFNTSQTIDASSEKAALRDIFSQFRLEKSTYISRLDKHFEALEKARSKIQAKHETLTNIDIAVLIGTDRVDSIVEDWNKLVEERRKIFEPRETFLNIINGMMQRKVFYINEQNELQIKTQSGKNLQITDLSSGEKQLLIVLGEALLQEKNGWVYIADEPELSLHVKWQEVLVENLRAINQNAQIIFATHSPDVVGKFSSRIFDMETLL